ncbi:transglycosylase domain-containing protein [Amycolatopsis nigrescens]|uniref:transglycosylase domain-containing protein n=1 Tax=Amycolatopsis nigrescens TaxID=381445 RepID=UPI000363E381|nr:transglycosylase domain-containing protein [Amycolatopsis nigrescens]
MRKRDGLFKLVGLCLLAGVLVAGVLFPVVGAAGVVSNRASETVDSMSADLANEPPPLVTSVTDSAGNQIATLYKQYRIPTAPDQISDAMKWALVSVEDRRFYEHHGVDWKGTIRAAVSTSGGSTQGASTLTQQYVKNYLINVTNRPKSDSEEDINAAKMGQAKAQEVSIARKLKEARIAIQLETKMTKEQILAGYLNVVEFSRQIYGIGAAAQTYFGVQAKDLNVAQSALLAGIVNNPIVFDPWRNPEKAKERRDLVLDRMVDNQKLAKVDADKAKAEPLGVTPGAPKKPAANCTGAGTENGFFCQYVEDYLLKSGMTKDDLYTGGYTIRTSMDQKANHEAKVSAESQVNKKQKNVANTLSLVRPGKEKHEVVALAANRDYGPDAAAGQTIFGLPSGVYNTGGAGSSYKIFTAAAALKEGKAGIFSNIQVPGSYSSSVFTGGGPSCPTVARGTRAYCLSNNEGSNYPSSMSLQSALATSPNTGFVILEEQAGMGSVVDMASKLGMRETMASNLGGGTVKPDSKEPGENVSQSTFFGPKENSPGQGSFTLGPSPLSGLELANVAATILSGGKWCPPTPIGQVTDRDGKPKQITEQPCEQVVEEGLANSLAVGMSKDEQPGGTSAAAASNAGWTRPLIGKTGTTQENGSATFVGGTPQLAGAAMVFRPEGGKGGLCDVPGTVITCPKGTMFGGRTPARTFYGAMNKIMEGQEVAQLPPSDPKYERAGR